MSSKKDCPCGGGAKQEEEKKCKCTKKVCDDCCPNKPCYKPNICAKCDCDSGGCNPDCEENKANNCPPCPPK